MAKIIIADKKQMLNTLIVIYSFNSAYPPLLKTVLKLDDAVIAQQLEQLTEMGILGGAAGQPKRILVKRDAARTIMNKNGLNYYEVEFNERIYQYQKQIIRTSPGAIEVPEKAIKTAAVDMVAVNDAAAKNERYLQKSKKIRNYLFYLVLVLGAIAGLVVSGVLK